MRATLLGLLSLALAGPAFAGSELQLGSNMPVVLYIDGESRGTVQPHEPLLIDIDSGVHNLRIQGVLGKDLYDRDLIFDDHTRTELVWQRKALRLGQVVKLDPNRPPTTEEDTELPIVPAHPKAPEAPEPPEAPAAEGDVAMAPPPPPPRKSKRNQAPEAPERPLAKPARVAEAPPPPKTRAPRAERPAPPAPAPVLANTAPPVREVKGPAPVPSGKGTGAVAIEAREGLDLQITHGSQLLRVTVHNGELVVIDSNGTEIHFPSDGDAW